MISITAVSRCPVQNGLGDFANPLQTADLRFYMIIWCPRGDLNTQTREISPVRGNHGTRVTEAGPACPGIRRGVRCSSRRLAGLMARAAAAGGSASAPLTAVAAASGSGALCRCSAPRLRGPLMAALGDEHRDAHCK
jgi:hypothetical protein